MSQLGPPLVKAVANSRVLDRSLFKRVLNVPAARVNASEVAALRTGLLKEMLLAVPRLKAVIPDQSDPAKRLILLDRSKLDADAKACSFLEIIPHALVLDYDFWSAEELLRSVLPDTVPVPSSYEMVGHILHLNLLPLHSHYKHLIGFILLSKHSPHIRTIVNKTGNIEARFRFFDMEILAGDEDTMVLVNEEGCRFKFDYAKVYWNSKLQHEHKRIVGLMDKGQVVVDVFAGVGPFAIPAAKHKHCRVLANDLNPESFKYLAENAKLNKVDKLVNAFNMDGREFLKEVFKGDTKVDHVVMNLPALAHEFLDVFNDISAHAATIHCYVFVRTGSVTAEALIRQVLHKEIDVLNVHHVRNVAPNKDMHCVAFRILGPKKAQLPAAVATTTGGAPSTTRAGKKPRIDDE